jgi:8-oxo-dGTP pyrophosphatase MutT (NUDIX family)
MSEHNPWKTHSSAVVYKNDWITVREDQVTRPDGKPGIYSVVETRIACGVVALTPNNEVYLVGQYRYPTECYSWEIIEGGAEKDEPPLQAIKRELQEEAGLSATEWTQLGPMIQLSNCHSSEMAIVFLARGLSETKAAPEGTELLQLKRVALAEAVKMCEDGRITDAMSIIGLARATKNLSRWSSLRSPSRKVT